MADGPIDAARLEPRDFPKWMYSTGPDAARLIVQSQAEQDALGPGWHDTPTLEPEIEPPTA